MLLLTLGTINMFVISWLIACALMMAMVFFLDWK